MPKKAISKDELKKVSGGVAASASASASEEAKVKATAATLNTNTAAKENAAAIYGARREKGDFFKKIFGFFF